MLSILLKLPLIPLIADYVWDDESLNAEYCLDNLFFNMDCFKRAIIKGLGIAIILGAFLNKAPILMNVIQKQSTAGLNKSSVYSELLVYTNCAFYGFLEQNPFTAYGENVALLLQNLVITLFIWNFNKISLQEIVLVVFGYGIVVYGILNFLPNNSLLLQAVFPMNVYAKGSQIWSTFQEKHTGSQSIVTLTLNVVGIAVRILTTIGEVGFEMNWLASYFSSLCLNGTLFAQYWIYKDRTQKYWEEQAKQKKE